MDRDEISLKVRTTIARVLNQTTPVRTAESITHEAKIGGWDDHNLGPDLEEDSLDRVEIVMGLEDEFGLEIPDEDATTWKTVGDMVDYISKKKELA